MSATLAPRGRVLFRDRGDAWANSLVLVLTGSAWLGSFLLMGSSQVLCNVLGVLLCAHAMVVAAYLVHEAAHQTLFAVTRANRYAGEAASFIAGASYASFERIRHIHIRHHVDRVDLVCFDFKGLLRRHPALRRALEAKKPCLLDVDVNLAVEAPRPLYAFPAYHEAWTPKAK